MGTCKYCGQSAGIFSSAHKECEEKHNRGKQDIETVLSSYFTGRITASDLYREKGRLTKDAYLTEEDLCAVADKEIRAFTATLHRPYSPSSMRLMDDFLNALGIAYSKVNCNGAVDEFTKKLMRGFMIDYFTDLLDLAKAHSRCEKVLSRFPMHQTNIEDAYLQALDKAATNFSKTGSISDDNQQKMDTYIKYLSLPIANLPAKYSDSDIAKIGQFSIMKKLENGIIPDMGVIVPIVLSRGEKVIWSYSDVNLYQEKVTREYTGRTGGFSIRIMKGLTYRTGQFKGRPVEKSTMENQGNGTLFITNKHLIFHSQSKSVKVPYSKLIGISPYSDGIEVNRDGTNVKRMVIQGFDPWFVLNILPYLTQSI